MLLNGFLWLNVIFFFPVVICASKEPQVSCVFNESCVLPCSFQSDPNPDIHWYKTPGDVPVHIYYYGQDQDSHQNQDFKDRTSLFVDQFSRGNASLLLREVKVQDEGTYRCYTSTTNTVSQESFINLRVRAPVSFVNIEQRGDELICSFKDIYPKPDVSWSLRPPPLDVEPNTSVSVSEKGLYSIFSSVRLSHKPPEEHSCNISTEHSWSSATYRLQHLQIISGNEVTVPCSASNAPIKSLIWKFNHIQTILTQTGTNRVYNESWRQFVEEVSESGRLILKNLSSGHQGVYSCLLSSDRETLISSTEVRAPPDPPSTTLYVVLGVFLFIIFILLIVSVLWWKRQKVLRLREIEERLRVLKQENKWLKGHQQELEDLLVSENPNSKTSEETLTQGNQRTSELLSQVSQHLRKIEKRLGEIKEEKKKLKKEKESLEALLLMKLFPEKDRSKDGQEKGHYIINEASAETLLNLNELTRGNQPPSEQVLQRLRKIEKRLGEIKEEKTKLKKEKESLEDQRRRKLFPEKDRSKGGPEKVEASTETLLNLNELTRGNQPPSEALSQVVIEMNLDHVPKGNVSNEESKEEEESKIDV